MSARIAEIVISMGQIKCGDCNKHWRCTTCDEPCGIDGHFVEVGESRREKIITILKANSSPDMSYVSSVDRFVTSDKFEQVADEILKMLVG